MIVKVQELNEQHFLEVLAKQNKSLVKGGLKPLSISQRCEIEENGELVVKFTISDENFTGNKYKYIGTRTISDDGSEKFYVENEGFNIHALQYEKCDLCKVCRNRNIYHVFLDGTSTIKMFGSDCVEKLFGVDICTLENAKKNISECADDFFCKKSHGFCADTVCLIVANLGIANKGNWVSTEKNGGTKASILNQLYSKKRLNDLQGFSLKHTNEIFAEIRAKYGNCATEFEQNIMNACFSVSGNAKTYVCELGLVGYAIHSVLFPKKISTNFIGNEGEKVKVNATLAKAFKTNGFRGTENMKLSFETEQGQAFEGYTTIDFEMWLANVGKSLNISCKVKNNYENKNGKYSYVSHIRIE